MLITAELKEEYLYWQGEYEATMPVSPVTAW
jgi:hypothetical protein